MSRNIKEISNDKIQLACCFCEKTISSKIDSKEFAMDGVCICTRCMLAKTRYIRRISRVLDKNCLPCKI